MDNVSNPLPKTYAEAPSDYPACATPPRVDEHGREYLPLHPWPGTMSVMVGPADAVALAIFWSDYAKVAAAAGMPEIWAFAEDRSRQFMAVARAINPYSDSIMLGLTAQQLATFFPSSTAGNA